MHNNKEFTNEDLIRERQKRVAESLGLPIDADWDQIDDIVRQQKAIDLGLPKDTPWEEIDNYNDKLKKLRYIQQLGLDEDATWEEIDRINTEKPRQK